MHSYVGRKGAGSVHALDLLCSDLVPCSESTMVQDLPYSRSAILPLYSSHSFKGHIFSKTIQSGRPHLSS